MPQTVPHSHARAGDLRQQAPAPPPGNGVGGPAPNAAGTRARIPATAIHAVLLGMLMTLAGSAAAYDIGTHRWEDRLLVIVASSPELAAVREARAGIAARDAAVRERRLRVLEVYAETARLDGADLPVGSSADLRRALAVAPGASRLLLIGLDGGVKRSAPLDTPLTELLAQIDAMPMRRQEIRERRAAGLPVTPP